MWGSSRSWRATEKISVTTRGYLIESGCGSGECFQILARYGSVLSQLVVIRTQCDQVIIIETKFEVFSQRYDMVNRQTIVLVLPSIIGTIGPLSAHPAGMIVSLSDIERLDTPGITPTEYPHPSSVIAPVILTGRFLWADSSHVVDPSAVSA